MKGNVRLTMHNLAGLIRTITEDGNPSFIWLNSWLWQELEALVRWKARLVQLAATRTPGKRELAYQMDESTSAVLSYISATASPNATSPSLETQKPHENILHVRFELALLAKQLAIRAGKPCSVRAHVNWLVWISRETRRHRCVCTSQGFISLLFFLVMSRTTKRTGTKSTDCRENMGCRRLSFEHANSDQLQMALLCLLLRGCTNIDWLILGHTT